MADEVQMHLVPPEEPYSGEGASTACKTQRQLVPTEDPEVGETCDALQRQRAANGGFFKDGSARRKAVLATVALITVAALALIASSVTAAASQFSNRWGSGDDSMPIWTVLADQRLADIAVSNAGAYAHGANASEAALRHDFARQLLELQTKIAEQAPELNAAMAKASLTEADRQMTLQTLRVLGAPRARVAAQALHSALNSDDAADNGLADADGGVGRLGSRIRAALKPHADTLSELRKTVLPAAAARALGASVDPERLPPVRAARARARHGLAPSPRKAQTWRGDAESVLQDQLRIVVELHSRKLGQALRRADTEGIYGASAERRLSFLDPVYTICADKDEDPTGCDLCPAVNGEMPTGCMHEQPNSCACTYGSFANAPAGQIPPDPQQGPKGCDPNCDTVHGFMNCFNGDESSRAGAGGMSLMSCLGQLLSQYSVTPMKNLWNDVSDPLTGDHDHL
eukprot:TRINITY_DN3269_c0_g6_i1.p1 TRINITY_DN3269_c0_g6~~TRINITY_DN3269_c0_g6_i1.p1  ORF type:complete len:459 (+),score=95.49 TRINITY_DN3269_c0_g6_i1:62-1438(+)